MKRLAKSLYLQVLVAVALGALLGHFFPAAGASLKPLGDAFIKLVKMLIAPIVFSTVVTGIAKMGDLRKVGRVGLKGIVYFEVLTTVALGIGLAVANVIRPGRSATPVDCIARRGAVVAMRPLTVHASSKSVDDRPRRVLHIEYAATVDLGDGIRLAVV